MTPIVAPNGRPARTETGECPVCRSPREKRVPSSGFGTQHDVCGACGYEFEEFTCG